MTQFSSGHAQWALLLGRVIIGGMFLMAGLSKIMDGPANVAEMIGGVGLPIPLVLAYLTIALEIGAGALLIAGYFTRKATIALIAFTLLATYFFHTDFSNPEMAQMQMMLMTKNLAIVGGMLAFLAVGAGTLSLDTKLRGSKSSHNVSEPSEPSSTM